MNHVTGAKIILHADFTPNANFLGTICTAFALIIRVISKPALSRAKEQTSSGVSMTARSIKNRQLENIDYYRSLNIRSKSTGSEKFVMFRQIVVLTLVVFLVATDAKRATTPKPPKECPKNEVWSWCGKVCEPDCGILQPGWTICPDFRCTDKTGDCRCKPGLVRNEKHVCIDITKCKNRQ